MKKILMLLFVAIATVSCGGDDAPVAQQPTNALKLFKTDGSEITDGSVITFNTNSSVSEANALKFYYQNTSSSAINVKVRFVSFAGVADTNELSFCYGPNINEGECLFSITEGSSYPRNGDAIITVPANGQVGGSGANKIQNSASPVSPATTVDYVFEAYQYDSNGNEVGNKVRFTYRYQP